MEFAGHEFVRGVPGVFGICFVCTGNICRSPMAETVFRRLAEDAGLADRLSVSSAATGDWHVGERADRRTLDVLAQHGYDGAAHRAKQFDPAWFAELDLVVTFDRGQRRILQEWAPDQASRDKVKMLLSFDHDAAGQVDVPDPYYSDLAAFDRVLAIIERASRSLFQQLEPAIRAS